MMRITKLVTRSFLRLSARRRSIIGLLVFSLLFYQAAEAQTYTTLFNFDVTDGAYPQGVVIQGNNGDIYGTTCDGGLYGEGTLFESTTSGVVSVVANFGSNGAGCPVALIQATNGSFYGTTQYGGPSNEGTIFRVTQAGSLTRLFSFNGKNGSDPNTLFESPSGTLYGSTCSGGGASDTGDAGNGTVFTITTDGSLTTIANFKSYGENCPHIMLQATDGNYYGITDGVKGRYNLGTIFKLTANGTLTRLYSFTGTNGEIPSALVQATNGMLYGVSCYGGAYGGGMLFSLTTDGILTTIASFGQQSAACPDTMLEGSDGNFYGTTGFGGANNTGTIYEVTLSGVLSVIASLPANANSSFIYHALVQGTDGVLYGTIESGGAYGYGMLYSATVSSTPSTPTVAPSFSGVLGSNGYYTSTVTLSWTVIGTPVPTTIGCDTLKSGDTTGTSYTCSASNSQGSASQTVTVKQDTVVPTISVTSPRKGTSYAINEVVKARYSCNDATSGVASCVGAVPNGMNVPTSSAGTYTFTVTGTDIAGNKTTKYVTYSVN